MSIINASDFIKKATKIIDIPGFEEGETFQVKIKPVSLLTMMTSGKFGNQLLPIAMDLFGGVNVTDDGISVDDIKSTDIMKDQTTMNILMQMMDDVCNEVMIEPTFAEIGAYMNDAQKEAVFTQAQGTNNVKPNNRE